MDIEADKREAMVFAASLVEQVNREDVANMVQVQRGMLQRFEKTNEMLINFNQLSFTRYEASVEDFQKHTQLLFEMKKDLDSVFKRIRSLKHRLSKSYPEAFAVACSSVIMMEDDEEDFPPPHPSDITSGSSLAIAEASKPTGLYPDTSENIAKTNVPHSQHPHPQAQRSRPTSQASHRSRESGNQQTARRMSVPKPEHRSLAGVRPPLSRSSSSVSSSSSDY